MRVAALRIGGEPAPPRRPRSSKVDEVGKVPNGVRGLSHSTLSNISQQVTTVEPLVFTGLACVARDRQRLNTGACAPG